MFDFWRKKVSFRPLESVDAVKVYVDLERKQVEPSLTETPSPSDVETHSAFTHTPVRELHDPMIIRALVHFVNERRDGWFDVMHTPVEQVRAIFFSQDDAIAIFASGPNYFLRGQFPFTKLIRAKDTELKEFERLLHIK